MFGMTRRQFLKRSKKTLNETGILILSIAEIMSRKNRGQISNEEASKEVNNIRKGIESIFSDFEENEPPSKCDSLKQRILKTLIALHESVIDNYDYLTAAGEIDSKNKLKESQEHMEEFRGSFLSIVKEVDSLLLKKRQNQSSKK